MNQASARLPRRRDEARALFRNAILDAAETVFAQRGFHGARIQDIAAQARIAVGTVYNHFAQKDDVLSALLEERTEEMLAQLLATDRAPTFEARLRARVASLLAYVEQHRAFFTVATEHGAQLFDDPGEHVRLLPAPGRPEGRRRAGARRPPGPARPPPA